MRIAILGPIEVSGPSGRVDITAPMQRRLLGLLLINRGVAVGVDTIGSVLWGDDAPRDPAGSVAFHVSKLRKLLDAGSERSLIETTPSGYRISESVETDTDEFETWFDDARQMLDRDPNTARRLLEDALGLWRGVPLADVGGDDFAVAEVQRLVELRVRAVQLLAETELASGNVDSAIDLLERLVGAEPLRERPVALLMRCFLAAGRRSEALTVFEACRSRLATELGIEPGAELQQVYEEALERIDATADVPNPYRGLRAFGESDTEFFFGREALTAYLVDRVSMGERLLAVVGPSGSGKSSVVRAGLIPRLRAGAVEGSERWPVCVMTPGLHPFEQLEAALLRGSGSHLAGMLDVLLHDERGLARAVQRLLPDGALRLVLVIDQFEELYRISGDAERAAFEAAIASAASDPSVPLLSILALRADHYDRPLAHVGLADLLGTGTVTVPPMGTSELARAISGPAGRVGVVVSPELEARIITDVMDRPGELPLVQFALTETFERRAGSGLGVEEYEEVGGVDGALVSVAEALFAELDHDEGDSVRRVLLHLVAVDGEGEARRRVALSDLATDGLTDEVLHRLDERRLVTLDRDPASGEATIEVAHEALFRAWPRFAGWIDTHRDDLSLRQRLTAATSEWTEAGEDAGYLLSGSRLDLFEGWAGTTDLSVGPVDSRFLEASLEARRLAEEQEESRRARELELEHRSKNRTRMVAGIGSVAILIAVVAVFAWTQRNQAQDAAAEATASEAEARAAEAEATAAEAAAVAAAEQTQLVLQAGQLATAAINNLGVDYQLSILLAYEAVATTARHDGSVVPEAVDALHWALQTAHVTFPYADPPVEARLGPDGIRGVFAIPIEDLLALAADSVTRGLTPEECQTYLNEAVCAPPTGTVYVGPLRELERTLQTRESLAGTKVLMASSATEDWAAFEALGSELGVTIVPAGDEIPRPSALPESGFEDVLDIILLPQPGLLPEYVSANLLIRIDAFVEYSDAVRRYGSDIAALGSVGADDEWPSSDGPLYGLMTKLDLKSLIWYSNAAFAEAGYTPPSTWTELETLVERIKADGGTPWCAGNWSQGSAGWPGTDWIEDLVLHTQGPEVYQGWVRGEIGFADPRIASAFTQYAKVVHGDGAYREPGLPLSETPFFVISPMFADPPRCWLARGASFLPGVGFHYDYTIPDDATFDDLGFFPFPSDDESLTSSVMVGGQFAIVLHDRPEVRAVIEALQSSEWYVMTAENGTSLIPDGDFDPAGYPQDAQQVWAALLARAKSGGHVVFDASDSMPDVIGTVRYSPTEGLELGRFYQLIVDLGDDRSYFEDPGLLMERLEEIDAAWAALDGAADS